MTEYTLEKRYKIFIHTLNNELEKMFKNQSEFICCKEGCSYCCEKGEYPFSRLEFDYLLEGYRKLDDKTKTSIKNKVNELNIIKENSTDDTFMYECPFLIDKKCCVYEHRGIICRTFGLLCEHNDGRLTIPFCHMLGLNYSKVYDKTIGQIVDKKDGIKLSETEPKAYRIQRDNIMNLSIAKNLNLEWGKSKTMLDYLTETNLSEY